MRSYSPSVAVALMADRFTWFSVPREASSIVWLPLCIHGLANCHCPGRYYLPMVLTSTRVCGTVAGNRYSDRFGVGLIRRSYSSAVINWNETSMVAGFRRAGHYPVGMLRYRQHVAVPISLFKCRWRSGATDAMIQWWYGHQRSQ
jgi:hypothetical protein